MSVDTQKARSVFLAAVENVDPEGWPAYVGEACGGDADLRREVEILLSAHRAGQQLAGCPDGDA